MRANHFRFIRSCRWLSAAAVLALALFSASPGAQAATLVLESASGGVYTYGFQLAAGEQLFFNTGDRITLTGLFGVTGASVGGPDLSGSLTTCGVTATSVCFGSPGLLDLDNISGATEDFGVLTIDSSSTTTGSVNYSLVGATPIAGEVGGPAAGSSSVPEPPTIPLFLGCTLLLGSLRKRR